MASFIYRNMIYKYYCHIHYSSGLLFSEIYGVYFYFFLFSSENLSYIFLFRLKMKYKFISSVYNLYNTSS